MRWAQIIPVAGCQAPGLSRPPQGTRHEERPQLRYGPALQSHGDREVAAQARENDTFRLDPVDALDLAPTAEGRALDSAAVEDRPGASRPGPGPATLRRKWPWSSEAPPLETKGWAVHPESFLGTSTRRIQREALRPRSQCGRGGASKDCSIIKAAEVCGRLQPLAS